MNDLIIEATKKTPGILFNSSGVLSISGRSIPEDASKFFAPVYSWLCLYGEKPNIETRLDIVLEYFNSGSAKSLLHILKIVAELNSKDYKSTINWHYETEDEDILERGHYYSSILSFPFNFIEIK